MTMNGEERRRVARHAFGVVQQVAEINEEKGLPAAAAFQRVQIVDVSEDGFSYYTLTRPQEQQVTVVMGDPGDLICLRARVVYAKSIQQWGHIYFRVGCEFTGNAKLDPQSMLSEEQDTEDILGELEFLMNLPLQEHQEHSG